MSKTLHMVRCKCCGTAQATTYAGWCVRCLMRGVKSMQAMSTPISTYLVECGLLKPGDKMPYEDALLALLRKSRDHGKVEEKLQHEPVIERATANAPRGPGDAEPINLDAGTGGLPQ